MDRSVLFPVVVSRLSSKPPLVLGVVAPLISELIPNVSSGSSDIPLPRMVRQSAYTTDVVVVIVVWRVPRQRAATEDTKHRLLRSPFSKQGRNAGAGTGKQPDGSVRLDSLSGVCISWQKRENLGPNSVHPLSQKKPFTLYFYKKQSLEAATMFKRR